MLIPEQDRVTWNGLVGELTRREIDIAAVPLSFTKSRSAVIEYSNGMGLQRKTLIGPARTSR